MASKAFSNINLQLSNLPQEVKDPQVYGELIQVYNACKILAQAIDVYTGIGGYNLDEWSQVGNSAIITQNHARIYPVAGDVMSAGMMVSLKDVGGVTYAIQAMAAAGDIRPCHGFATGPTQSNGRVEVVLQGLYPYAGGLTIGRKYFLASTYSQFTATTPSVSGNIRQAIGYALSPNALFFQPAIDYLTIA